MDSAGEAESTRVQCGSLKSARRGRSAARINFFQDVRLSLKLEKLWLRLFSRHTVWCDEFPARCGPTRVLQTRIIKAARHLLARLPSLCNALQVVPLASDDSGTLKRRHFFFFFCALA